MSRSYAGFRRDDGRCVVYCEPVGATPGLLEGPECWSSHMQLWDWGRGPSNGAWRLAAIILADVTDSESWGYSELQHAFAVQVIGKLPRGQWRLTTEEIMAWMEDWSMQSEASAEGGEA